MVGSAIAFGSLRRAATWSGAAHRDELDLALRARAVQAFGGIDQSDLAARSGRIVANNTYPRILFLMKT
ncbi:hypothetical protein KCP74_14895 [Salmonella enterica subsp. enterica]|nr:hypothetical protein KCP74_14895 [Salmonella enterica subsp. enterica]